jgi:hypothetical protein|nr:MAG TPA: hypothetical protein [Caudoviricetes sp.]
MTVKELIQVLENCEEDGNVYMGCKITGLEERTILDANDIYEQKGNGSIIFDFSVYIFQNELEDKFGMALNEVEE